MTGAKDLVQNFILDIPFPVFRPLGDPATWEWENLFKIFMLPIYSGAGPQADTRAEKNTEKCVNFLKKGIDFIEKIAIIG